MWKRKFARSFSRAVGRFAPYGVGAYASSARKSGRYGMQSYGGISSTGRNVGVSTQYDTKVTYTKRKKKRGSIAAKKRKYAKKFRKRYQYNLMKDLGTRSIVLNNSLSGSIADLTDIQDYRAIHLWGYKGLASANEAGEADIASSIFLDDNVDSLSQKCFASHGYLDITFQNTSASTKLEVDVYWLGYKKTASIDNLTSAIANAEGATTIPPGSGGVNLTMTQRGCTPFNLPVLSAAGIKILKKTKHFVQDNGFFSTSWKDTKHRMLSPANDQTSGNQMNYKGMTVTCFVVVKKIVGDTGPASYSIGATRTYAYKVLLDNKDYDGYITAP